MTSYTRPSGTDRPTSASPRPHTPQIIALDDDAEDVLEELEVMRGLNHINVVRVFDAFWAHQGRCFAFSNARTIGQIADVRSAARRRLSWL